MPNTAGETMGKALHFCSQPQDSCRKIMEGHECKLLLPILLSGDEHYFVLGLFLSICTWKEQSKN